MTTFHEGHGDSVTSLAFSPRNLTLVSGSMDTTVRIWFTPRNDKIVQFAAHTQVLSVAFSPEGDRIAAGCMSGKISVWDVYTGNLLKAFELPDRRMDPVYSVSFGPNGRRLLSASQDKTVKVWVCAHHDDRELSMTLEGHKVDFPLRPFRLLQKKADESDRTS